MCFIDYVIVLLYIAEGNLLCLFKEAKLQLWSVKAHLLGCPLKCHAFRHI